MKRRIVLLLLIVSMLTLLTACASPLVGCWNTTIDGIPGQMSLYKDGTGEIVSGGVTRSCSWYDHGDRLSVVQDIDGAKFVFLDNVSYVIEGDTLTVTSYEGSNVLEFTKD